jgi:hypothetical protein
MTAVRYRRFQFSLTTLLMLVTFSAVGTDYFRRRQAMLKAAHDHRLSELACTMVARELRREIVDGVYLSSYAHFCWSKLKVQAPVDRRPLPPESQLHKYLRLSSKADFHRQVAVKYECAAWFPWTTVNEDDAIYRYFRDGTNQYDHSESASPGR